MLDNKFQGVRYRHLAKITSREDGLYTTPYAPMLIGGSRAINRAKTLGHIEYIRNYMIYNGSQMEEYRITDKGKAFQKRYHMFKWWYDLKDYYATNKDTNLKKYGSTALAVIGVVGAIVGIIAPFL